MTQNQHQIIATASFAQTLLARGGFAEQGIVAHWTKPRVWRRVGGSSPLLYSIDIADNQNTRDATTTTDSRRTCSQSCWLALSDDDAALAVP
jgi:hypothetical protein